jgi:hypothetical protein
MILKAGNKLIPIPIKYYLLSLLYQIDIVKD